MSLAIVRVEERLYTFEQASEVAGTRPTCWSGCCCRGWWKRKAATSPPNNCGACCR